MNVQKLLPPSKPVNPNLANNKQVNSPVKESVVNINKKLGFLGLVFRQKTVLRKNIIKNDKRREETEQRRDRERALENRKKKNVDKKDGQELLKNPMESVKDRLLKFAGFTFLGFLLNNAEGLLPKLIQFSKDIEPGIKFFGGFLDNVVQNTIGFVEAGYNAYDTVKGWIREIGGEDYERLFTSFSGALNLFLQGTLIAGLSGGFGPGKDLSVKGKTAEALTKGKTAFSGETALSAKNRRRVFDRITTRREEVIKRRQQRQARVVRNQVKRRQELTRRQFENRARLDKIKERQLKKQQEKQIQKAMQVDPTRRDLGRGRGLAGNIFEGILPEKPRTKRAKEGPRQPKKPPQTLRMGPIKYAERRGGDYVDFGLPGQQTKRMTSEQALGIKYMFENPKDRYTKQIAYEAFKNPDLYDTDIKSNYREFVKSQFKGAKMQKPGARTKPLPTSLAASRAAGKQAAKTGLRRGARMVPFIGPMLDIFISVLSGDPIDEAVVGTLGATLGGFVGTAIVGAGTFGIGAVLGAGLGSLVGDIIARSLYQSLKSFVANRNQGLGSFNQGGVVSNRRVKVNAERKKAETDKLGGIVEPQQSRPQPDFLKKVTVGSEAEGKKLFTEDGIKNIKNFSKMIKDDSGFGGIFASVAGAYTDMLLGQQPDLSIAKRIGKVMIPLTNKEFGDKVSRDLEQSLRETSSRILGYASTGDPITLDDEYDYRRDPELFPENQQTPLPSGSLPPLPPTNTVAGQNYGASRDGGRRKHAGVDFDISGNEKFYSRIGGKVIYAGNAGGGYGNVVDIYNKDLNVTERIAEAARILPGVVKGAIIRRGQAVVEGEGSTGVIHYEIRPGKAGASGSFKGTVNPLDYLKKLEKKEAQVAPAQKVSTNQELNQQTSYEVAIHERNIIMYQKEVVLS